MEVIATLSVARVALAEVINLVFLRNLNVLCNSCPLHFKDRKCLQFPLKCDHLHVQNF